MLIEIVDIIAVLQYWKISLDQLHLLHCCWHVTSALKRSCR